MEAGDDNKLAGQQLASVASILLAWMRADAVNDDGDFSDGDLAVKALKVASASPFRNKLEPVLRALFERTALARTAACLACTCQAVRHEVSQHNADLVGAAGAARCAHAAGMARIVVATDRHKSLREDERICTCAASLCEVSDEVADWNQLADDVTTHVLTELQATAGAMFGGPGTMFDGPLQRAMMSHLCVPLQLAEDIADMLQNVLKLSQQQDAA